MEQIDENLTYDYLHSSESNLWSVLYTTGYLTQARFLEDSEDLTAERKALIIPNAEIREIFETTIMKWFADTVKTWDRTAIFQALWQNDDETITKEMKCGMYTRVWAVRLKNWDFISFSSRASTIGAGK